MIYGVVYLAILALPVNIAIYRSLFASKNCYLRFV